MHVKHEQISMARKYSPVKPPKLYRVAGLRHGYDGEIPPVLEPVRDIDGDGKRTIVREMRYDTVGWLLKHRRIDAYQEAAARRLQRDAETAEILPQASSGTGGTPKLGVLSDAQLTAMVAHADALRAVRKAFDTLGSAGEKLVTLVVIENKTLGKAAAIMRQQQQGALFALKIALDALAKFYGLA